MKEEIFLVDECYVIDENGEKTLNSNVKNHTDLFEDYSDSEVKEMFLKLLEEEFKDNEIKELMVQSWFGRTSTSGFKGDIDYCHTLRYQSSYEVSWYLDNQFDDDNLKVITFYFRNESYMRILSVNGIDRIPIKANSVEILLDEVRINLSSLKK